MRVTISGAVGLAAVGLLSLAPTGANAQKAEFALLGNKLWNKFEDVLRKHGQPTRIEVGAAVGGVGSGATTGAGGSMSGGMMGGGMMPGGGGSPYGGGMSGGVSGSPYGSGMMSGGMGMRGGGKFGGMNAGGGMAMPGGGGGPLPGLSGGGGDEGLGGTPRSSGAFGGGMAGGSGGVSSSNEEGEITWVYEKGPLTDLFLFNKDGRLIQISTFGYSGGGGVTSRGVRLGDPIGKIYATYGWTANITKDDTRGTMTLDYAKDHHVAFQLAHRGKVYKVVGITIGISEVGLLQSLGAPSSITNNARGASGSMGGMMSSGGPMAGMGGGPGGFGQPAGVGGGKRGRSGGGGGAAGIQ